MTMATAEAVPARKYRSRKQKPCDNCRRRRVCCVRDAEGDCALCSRRSIPCTFSSEPSARKRKVKTFETPTGISAAHSPGPSTGTAQDHPVAQSHGRALEPPRSGVDIGEGKYIGLSGTDDVYFALERDQAIGNDPAREAYFRVGTMFWRSYL